MKLTVIGFWGAYPGKDGATSGYLLQAEGYSVLLDCGSGVLSKLHGYVDPCTLNSVVISHYHPDHIADAGVLRHAAIVQKALGKRDQILTLYGHKEEPYFGRLSFEDITRGVEYKEGREYDIGPFKFNFLRAIHPVTAFSMRIDYNGRSIGYTGDTQWNVNAPSFFKGVDLLVCESSLFVKFKGAVPGHMSSDEAGTLAKKSDAGRLILTHLPHYGDHSELVREAAAEYGGPIELASEGKSWTI